MPVNSKPMRSVSHLTALDAAPEDFVRYAAAAGFDAVGLRINPPPHTPAHWPVAGDRARTKALRQLMDGLGLRVLETEGFSIRPQTRVADMLPALECAAELGARYVLSGGLDDDEVRLVDTYGELCTAAARFNLRVGMEFMSWIPMRCLEDALRVLKKVNADNAGILIDTLHFCRSGSSVQALRTLPREYLAYVQLCDAAATLDNGNDLATEARNGRAYPGEGMLPLDEILTALPSDIDISVEAPAAAYAHLPPEARILRAGSVTQSYLSRHPAGTSAPHVSTR